mmetsp:Transcript_3454/g.7757  ORF Transcript_3454/g.7757 Transcript_3454/m.7757 type:complete len:280 (-) Transcript_3454:190-1029(-)
MEAPLVVPDAPLCRHGRRLRRSEPAGQRTRPAQALRPHRHHPLLPQPRLSRRHHLLPQLRRRLWVVDGDEAAAPEPAAAAPVKALATAKEALGHIRLNLQRNLVQQLVEGRVVGADGVVYELVEHRAEHVLVREEARRVARRAEPEADLRAPVHVQSEQVRVFGIELTHELDPPPPAPHQGLHLLGDALQHSPRLACVPLPRQLLELPAPVRVVRPGRGREVAAAAAAVARHRRVSAKKKEGMGAGVKGAKTSRRRRSLVQRGRKLSKIRPMHALCTKR